MPQPRRVSTCSRTFSSTLATTRSAPSSRITSSFGFFGPPTRVLVATPTGGSVQYTVPCGQWALRLLPPPLLPVFRNDDPRLAITLGRVRLPNPLILSSMYYDTTILRRAMGLGFGAPPPKST